MLYDCIRVSSTKYRKTKEKVNSRAVKEIVNTCLGSGGP